MASPSDPVADFTRLLKAWDDARDRHSDVGADDSEPCGKGNRLIYKASLGKEVEVPTTGDAWSLFDPDPEDPDPKITDQTVAAAAKDLHDTCLACVTFLAGLGEVRHADAVAIKKLCKDNYD